MVNTKTILTWSVLGALTLGAAALRVWGMQAISLDVDEAITISAARGLLETGEPRILASGLYYGRDILGTLTTAASLAIFGVSEWAARLPMVLMGIAVVPLTYVMARQLSAGRVASLASAAIVMGSEWAIYFSHSARMYQEQQFFVVLTCIVLFSLLRRFSWGRFVVMCVLSCLAVLAHRSALVIPFVALAAVIWQYRGNVWGWWKKPQHRWWVGGASIVLLGAALVWQVEADGISDMGRYLLGTDRNPFRGMELKFVPFKHLLQYYPAWLGFFVLAHVAWRRRPAVQAAALVVWVVFVSVDVLIYPHEPNYRTRYFYDCLPILYAVAAVGISQLFLWQAKKISFHPVLRYGFALIVALGLFFPGTVRHPAQAYDDQPEWNILRNLPADVVIAHPTAPAAFYLGHVEYWLVSHKGEIRTYSENNSDIYAGAQILITTQELTRILTTQHGIVALETNRLAYISKKLRTVLKQYAVKDAELSTELLQIWRF